jgi:hypothetical protein
MPRYCGICEENIRDGDVHYACRIAELEIAIRAALSYIQNQPGSQGNGHAEMVIAALRGALRNSAERDSLRSG